MSFSSNVLLSIGCPHGPIRPARGISGMADSVGRALVHPAQGNNFSY